MAPPGILREPEGSITNGNICLVVSITNTGQSAIIPLAWYFLMHVCARYTVNQSVEMLMVLTLIGNSDKGHHWRLEEDLEKESEMCSVQRERGEGKRRELLTIKQVD